MSGEFATASMEMEHQKLKEWIDHLGNTQENNVKIMSVRQGWGKLCMGRSIINEPLSLADRKYAWGLGTHADSEIVLRSAKPIRYFRTVVGVDANPASLRGKAALVFSIRSGDKILTQSSQLSVKSAPEQLEVELDGINELVLSVQALNGINFAHADWAETEIILADGEKVKIGIPGSLLPGYLQALPLQFKYADESSEFWFRRWGITHTKSEKADYITHKYICSDPETGLTCTLELQAYKRLPALLWNVYFTNSGTSDTPLLEDIASLDLSWVAANEKTLYYSRGAFSYPEGLTNSESFRDNFMLEIKDMTHCREIILNGTEGKPSSAWMPYFNFASQDEGLLFGIGWTGQWLAKINSYDDGVHFRAGMENISTVLHPGETIRQPEILMLYWQGNEPLRGHNRLRRFIIDYLQPKYRGQPIHAPASSLTWGGMTAAGHLERIRNIHQQKLPLDYYWIDAGWYGQAGPNDDEFSPEWGSQAGNWLVNRETYPQGFKAISDAVHSDGKKFLLWCEPERAIYGTPITIEHPEWFLGDKVNGHNQLLNLGIPAAREWCTELIAGLINDNDLDCYRQDFNINPLPFWKSADTPNRRGISEIRYVEGLYAFLDELRRRYPYLLIDNCAGGGNRLDLEMMKRGIPLWASDMQCFPDYATERNHQLVTGLSYWIPQFALGTQNHPDDTYHFRATMAAGVTVHMFCYEKNRIDPNYSYQWLRERLVEYHSVKEFFSGDFYPLCEQNASFRTWCAYQFFRPDLDAGILLVFRKKDSPIEKIRFHLQGLIHEHNYQLKNADNGEVLVFSGLELTKNGLPVEITEKRDCRLFYIKTIESVHTIESTIMANKINPAKMISDLS